MTNGLLIYGEIFAHFLKDLPHMTLQLLHSEFPYILGKFSFLFYPCTCSATVWMMGAAACMAERATGMACWMKVCATGMARRRNSVVMFRPCAMA